MFELWLFLFGGMILGCASVGGCAHTPDPSSESSSSNEQLSPGVYAIDAGESISKHELFERLADHRCVVVGESHGTPWHHELEADVFQTLHDRFGEIALGMEMFQRPFQSALTAYVSKEMDEETMLERTEYAKRWGVEPSHYRPLWSYAREHDLSLVALNARAELTREVSKVGLEGLSSTKRSQLPDEIDTSHEAHRDFVRRAFGQHGEAMSDAQFEHFYQAQVVWDETMAHRTATFLENHSEVEAMVILTGMFHAHRGFAIPPRLERRLPGGDNVATLVPLESGGSGPWSGASLEELREQNVADFVWVR